MPDVSQSVLVEFTPEQTFSLVDRVEDYSKFLPWCGGATLVEAFVKRAGQIYGDRAVTGNR